MGTYGYLYNWYAVGDSRKICPVGWHVPTDAEWTSLIQFIDASATANATIPQSSTAGGKMKANTLWAIAGPPIPGTDNYDFSALGGGFRDIVGAFGGIGTNTLFWSTSANSVSSAYLRSLEYSTNDVDRYDLTMSGGASVRCIKD